jgi:hypothetical protein
MRLVSGTWTPQVAFPIPAPTDDTYEVGLMNTSGPLQLFVRPVDTSALGNPTFDRPMFLLEFDGSAWSPPVELTSVGANELAHLPFSFGGSSHRLYQPANSSLVSLAELDGTSFSPVSPVLDIDGVDFIQGFFSRMLGSSSFASFLARPVAATQGSQRELVVEGATTALRGDRKLRATRPFILKDAAGPFHVFNQEQELFRVPNVGVFVDRPAFTSYYTTAPLASSALPSVPTVVDDGAITSSDRELSASWSSSHAAGIVSYRVAWGTQPGGDDLLPWQETTATELTFSLGDQRLLPGQTAYASVQARSGALLSSDIGVSDGITFEPPAANLCTAPPWNSTVVYVDPGTLVTYQGATWENQYQQSQQTPGGGAFAWEFVAECVGDPVLPPCTAPAWSSSQPYSPGNRVSHNGFEFENLWPSAVPPDGSSGNPWKWVLTCQP